VSVEEAQEQLKKFEMGMHLPHAPAAYLQSLAIADLIKLWRKEEIQEIPYQEQVLRGK